jgi:ribonuclease H / adenosylcobalamin/alpha-ribazole phosphatase
MAEKPVRFFLVRHGETAENVHMRYLGTRDEPLTEKGLRQAGQAAEALSQLKIKVVVSSPMRRARDTAIQIQQACGAELRLDSRLAEGSFGRWEGLNRDDVLNLGGEDAKALLRWESDASVAPPGGESIQQIQHRVTRLVDELKSELPGCSIVLVSHVGPIKALTAAALGIPLEAARWFFLDPGTISVLEWGRHPVLRLFNSHCHFGWLAARWM